ncbi:MAG: transglutaminase family protein [Bacteroidota bacterium]
MNFNLFSELSYEVYSPTTFVFNIQAARSASQKILKESLLITIPLSTEEFELDEVRFIKLHVDKPMFFTLTYNAEVEVDYKIIDESSLFQSIPLINFDKKIYPYLFPSRHCQSDKLEKLALKEFGKYSNEYSKVSAITDWIFNNIDYISGSTDAGTSAYDTVVQRQGVCKDFAHLGIALCRALNIPARYFTGYAYQLGTPDFHACFEAYLGNQWIIFDPTKMVPINGLVKIANGKDAAEVAVGNFFGNTICTYMNVQSTTSGNFIPYKSEGNVIQAISY